MKYGTEKKNTESTTSEVGSLKRSKTIDNFYLGLTKRKNREEMQITTIRNKGKAIR